MYLGLDIGTSAIKAVLLDEGGALVAQHSASLTVSRLHPGWSEQQPEDWWQGCLAYLDAIAAEMPKEGDGGGDRHRPQRADARRRPAGLRRCRATALHSLERRPLRRRVRGAGSTRVRLSPSGRQIW